MEDQLPASIDSERTILGAILLDNESFNEAAESLMPEDFFLDSHRRIFQRMMDLMDASHAVDIVTLAEELNRNKEVEAVGGIAYLASLTEGLPRHPVIAEYIRVTKDKSQLRRLMKICTTVIARAADQSETALQVLEDCEGQLLEIAQEANVGKLRSIYQSVEVVGGTENYLKAYTEPSLKTGLQTGFLDLDRMTGGLQPSELTIIGARPSAGKSAIALNIMENVCCGTNMVAALFSLEMSRASIERRFMASRARVNVKRAMDGWFLSALEKEKLGKALADLVEAHIFIDDSSSLTPTQLRAKCRRLKAREQRLDLILVDYAQLMSAGQRTGNREQEIALISRSLKALAKESETPVVALAQLNRGVEQMKEKRPTLASLRESGQLEQDGDLILLLHREEMYDQDNPEVKGLADLIVAKARSGPTGVVKLAYEAEITRFGNLVRSNQ